MSISSPGICSPAPRGKAVIPISAVLTLALCSGLACTTPGLPSGPPVEVVLPDYGAEVRAFEARPPAWNEGVVNAAWGGGRGGPERAGGWLKEHWPLLDVIDRSADYSSHEYLDHRGVFYDAPAYNEYQETIHFDEAGALRLFGDNGIARDYDNQRVLSPDFNLSVERWAKTHDYNAYIVDNNAPRWSAVIHYDWLTTPLLGYAISQDNLGAPISKTGLGSRGRYDDYNNRKFLHHLELTRRLPEYRSRKTHIREYIQTQLMPIFGRLPPRVRWPGDRAARLRLCEDPVLAEYQLFLHLSHLHNVVRYYGDSKLVADRAKRPFDVHGNQGAQFVGMTPYQVVLSDFVDTIWFEASGVSAYDIFEHGWSNAWGSFRFELGEAMARGRKPVMMMSRSAKGAPDITAHEWAEASAGGGVLFVNQRELDDDAELLALLNRYFSFRDEHRAIFERRGRRRHCQVALLYSVPSFLYSQYLPTFWAPPMNDLAGAARALEEGHVPYDVVILDHPDLRSDRLSLDQLLRYRVVVAPSVEALSERHAQLLGEYLEAGGTLLVLGRLGVRDERYRRRTEDLLRSLSQLGEVATPLGARSFPRSRQRESEATRSRSRQVFAAVRDAVDRPLIRGSLPRMLWVKTWLHAEGFLSAHFVNYALDFGSRRVTPTQPAKVSIGLPAGVAAEEAVWLVPGEGARQLGLRVVDGAAQVSLPAVHVYGVLVIGPRGLEAAASRLRRGDRGLLRARMAGASSREALDRVEQVRARRETDTPAAYSSAAMQLLRSVAAEREQEFLRRTERLADAEGARLAFDFGARGAHGSWRPVTASTRYSKRLGYGWLPSFDDSPLTPEERYYGPAWPERGGENAIQRSGVPFWPHDGRLLPEPLRTSLHSGRQRRFRIDLPDGLYRVAVLHGNGARGSRGRLVSGMTRVEGLPVLLDVPLAPGSLRRRSFVAKVQYGSLELSFGGATGWEVAGLLVWPVTDEEGQADSLARGGIRSWRLSRRHANPDWYPIEQVRAAPESDLAEPDTEAWSVVKLEEQGLPVVDLGTSRQADIGDVVYAAAIIEQAEAGSARLSLGASSSALAWLNGERVVYLPNLKGVMRDEATAEVSLRKGRNVLLLKLQRFWERHWLFYAALEEHPRAATR